MDVWKLQHEVDEVLRKFREELKKNCAHKEWTKWIDYIAFGNKKRWKFFRVCKFCGKEERTRRIIPIEERRYKSKRVFDE